MRVQLAILAALLIMLGSPLISLSADSNEKLVDEIAKEKIFSADTKVRVATQGAEATVTTFRESSATTDDCKINAILVGKSVFAQDPAISHVTVRFHDPRMPAEYNEVRVTVGDVKAFATGTISKEQLLSAVELTKHVELATVVTPSSQVQETPGSTSTPTSESTSSSKSQSTSVASATLPESSGSAANSNRYSGNSAKLPAGTSNYKNYGLSLNYPSVWKVNFAQTGNVLLRFYPPAESHQPSIIEMRLYSTNTNAKAVSENNPETLFYKLWEDAWIASMSTLMGDEATKRFERPGRVHRSWRQSGVPVAGVQVPATLKLGQGKSVPGFQRAYWATAPMSPREYMRTVSFSNSQYVFQLLLLCPEKDSTTANGEFELLLNDLKLANSAPPAAIAASTRKK